MNQLQRLPSYQNPPVVEVVASIQFEPLPNLNVAYLGLLWQRFRKTFPKVEQKPPIAPVVERLGVRAPLNQIQLQLSDGIDVPRLWFVNDAGDELVQVQPDRFIRNWRAIPNVGKPYPRYQDHIRPRFIEDYREFQGFLKSELSAQADPNQCEITYINHITPNEHWSSHKDLASVFRGWNSSYSSLVEQPVEAINLRAVHLLNDETGQFVGRLHIIVQSAFKGADRPTEVDQPIFVLTITARGKPMGEGESGFLEFFDAGRKAIVSAFDRITTPEMHRVWGKRYDS